MMEALCSANKRPVEEADPIAPDAGNVRPWSPTKSPRGSSLAGSAMAALDRDRARQHWVINGRFATQPMTGVQRYAFEVVTALDKLLRDNRDAAERLAMRLIVPSAARAVPSLANIDVRQASFGTGHAFDQLVMPIHGIGAGMLSLGNLGPVASRRHIVCIHDANTFIMPDSYSRSFGLAYRTLLPLIGGRASRVATVSSFSASMLTKYGVCSQEKLFIAPNGHEHVLRWDAKRAQLPAFRRPDRPFVLLLGSRAKHKNVDVILNQAQALEEAGIDIVVTGGSFGIFSSHERGAQRSNVHQLGFVGDDELAALYGAALCLVFPSKTEGFGIPPLEAMTLGCPVISSNAASLVEVGGDAVLYVDPDDEAGWRQAIVGLAGNNGLRHELISRARSRINAFTWMRSAGIYLEQMLRLSG
jgi:glycosyltransferase involved in cell wall biosynthesis